MGKNGPPVTIDDLMSVKLKSAGERKDRDLNVRGGSCRRTPCWMWLSLVFPSAQKELWWVWRNHGRPQAGQPEEDTRHG